jgi:PAP_fibrillin
MACFFIILLTAASLLLYSPAEALTAKSPTVCSRRDALASAASVVAWLGSNAIPAQAKPLAEDAIKLRSLIPKMDFDAPATNATISPSLTFQIESLAASMENQQTNNAESPLLMGNWKLLYTNGAEITSLATNLPLGFQLGKTTQPNGTNVFENRGTLEHPWRLAHWQTNVLGDVRVAPQGSVNAAGVFNDRNNRVDVDFRVLVFVLDKVLGQPVSFQKALIPKSLVPGQPQPANDITYLDERMRIVRGGDGALFVFERYEEEASSLGTKEERDVFLSRLQPKSKSAEVGMGATKKSTSPELQFLFQERKQ